jgi:hypothetical protein
MKNRLTLRVTMSKKSKRRSKTKRAKQKEKQQQGMIIGVQCAGCPDFGAGRLRCGV